MMPPFFQQLNQGVIGLRTQGSFQNLLQLVREGETIQAEGEQGTQTATLRLENEAQDTAGKDTQGDAGDGGHLHGYGHDNDNGGQQQDGVDVEETALGCVQSIGKFSHAAHIGLAAVILHSAQHTKDHQSDHIGDGGGDHHGLHVSDNVSAGHSGGQVRGVRQRRHLVAEIRTGYNSACYQRKRSAHTCRNTHQGHADGSRRTPGGSGTQGKPLLLPEKK